MDAHGRPFFSRGEGGQDKQGPGSWYSHGQMFPRATEYHDPPPHSGLGTDLEAWAGGIRGISVVVVGGGGGIPVACPGGGGGCGLPVLCPWEYHDAAPLV